jgi:TolA-binding protein
MALAAPSQLLINLLGGKNKKVEKILLAQKGRIQAEQTHRIAYDQVIKQKEQHIQELKAKIAQMEDKVDSLELQQKTIEKTVNKTSDIDQLSDEFLQAYGDED